MRTQVDIDRAQQFVMYPDDLIRLANEFARIRAEHDARVTELLDANNRFEQRARLAERELEAANLQMRQLGKMLGDLGRERDELAARMAEFFAPTQRFGSTRP